MHDLGRITIAALLVGAVEGRTFTQQHLRTGTLHHFGVCDRVNPRLLIGRTGIEKGTRIGRCTAGNQGRSKQHRNKTQ